MKWMGANEVSTQNISIYYLYLLDVTDLTARSPFLSPLSLSLYFCLKQPAFLCLLCFRWWSIHLALFARCSKLDGWTGKWHTVFMVCNANEKNEIEDSFMSFVLSCQFSWWLCQDFVRMINIKHLWLGVAMLKMRKMHSKHYHRANSSGYLAI